MDLHRGHALAIIGEPSHALKRTLLNLLKHKQTYLQLKLLYVLCHAMFFDQGQASTALLQGIAPGMTPFCHTMTSRSIGHSTGALRKKEALHEGSSIGLDFGNYMILDRTDFKVIYLLKLCTCVHIPLHHMHALQLHFLN